MRMRVLVTALLILGPVPHVVAQQAEATDDTSLIIVAGSATESVAPDGVTIRLLASSLERRPGEAAAAVDESVDAVVQAIESLSIDDLIISRVGYGVGPVWERRADGERRFNGYAGRLTIRIETGSLEAVGSIVEAGISSGATQVQDIRYSSSRLDEVRRSALRSAVEAARLDAEAMAEAAGGTLGRLMLLTTERTARPQAVSLEAMSVQASRGQTVRAGTEVTPEDLTVHARVESRWLFLPSVP